MWGHGRKWGHRKNFFAPEFVLLHFQFASGALGYEVTVPVEFSLYAYTTASRKHPSAELPAGPMDDHDQQMTTREMHACWLTVGVFQQTPSAACLVAYSYSSQPLSSVELTVWPQ